MWVGAELLHCEPSNKPLAYNEQGSVSGSLGDQLRQLINQNSDKSGKEKVIGIGDRVWFKFFTTSLNGERITHVALGKVEDCGDFIQVRIIEGQDKSSYWRQRWQGMLINVALKR